METITRPSGLHLLPRGRRFRLVCVDYRMNPVASAEHTPFPTAEDRARYVEIIKRNVREGIVCWDGGSRLEVYPEDAKP